MKKFIAMVALVASMFTVNSTVANAQVKWGEEANYTIHKVHTMEYLEKGDDAYRMGHYQEAMNCYKSAREHNKYRDTTIVPVREIERKMERCADAMRREETMRRIESIAAANRPAPAAQPAAARNDGNGLCNVNNNGLSYTTTTNNRGCSVLSVKSEADYTVVEMEFINTGNNATSINIGRDTFLKDRNSGTKYSLRDVEGIGIDTKIQVLSGESQVFRLYFNRIGSAWSEVDMVEPGTS